MAFILGALIIIIFIVYYLEKYQSSNRHKATAPAKIIAPKIPTIAVENIYGVKKEVFVESVDTEQTAEQSLDVHFINSDEYSPEKKEKILNIVQAMPTPHPLIRTLTKEIESSEQLYQLVKKDPQIADKILHAVNSSGFYLSHPITHLKHAILYLGTNMVKNISLQTIILPQSKVSEPHSTKAMNRIWSNAFLASSLTFLFAKNLALKNAHQLAIRSLFAYIGNIAIISYQPQLAYCFTKSLSLADRIEIEQSELGVNSAAVGSALAALWQLPQPLISGIKNHLLPLSPPPHGLSKEALYDSILCYCCCYIAEESLNKSIHDISDINLLDSGQKELTYLAEYINTCGLKGFLFLQRKPAFRNEAKKLIEKIGSAPGTA